MDCKHQQIILVYTTGNKLPEVGIEKDLLIRCGDCDKEMFRTSTYGKQIINLCPQK